MEIRQSGAGLGRQTRDGSRRSESCAMRRAPRSGHRPNREPEDFEAALREDGVLGVRELN